MRARHIEKLRIGLVMIALVFGGVAGPLFGDEAPAKVALYTMGPGDTAFSRFGHAAVCVFDNPSTEGRCYNYGTADFSTPVPLTWNVLKGKANFWLSVIDHDRMIQNYRRHDRTVYRQFLPLTPDQTSEMLRRLTRDATPDNKSYIYDHFEDNCSTRPRDLIDLILPGRLRAATDRDQGDTLRHFVREGLAYDLRMLALSELALGRALDAPRTRWQAMFLPRVLRQEVQKHLGAVPEVVYVRRGPDRGGDLLGGVWVLAGLALALGVPGCAAVWWGGERLRRLGLLVPAVVVSLVGLSVVIGPLISTLPEFQINELLLVLLPTDVGLAFLAGRALRRGLTVRTAMVLAAAVLSLAGWFVQPILGPLLLAGAVLVPGWLTAVRQRRLDWRRVQ